MVTREKKKEKYKKNKKIKHKEEIHRGVI